MGYPLLKIQNFRKDPWNMLSPFLCRYSAPLNIARRSFCEFYTYFKAPSTLQKVNFNSVVNLLMLINTVNDIMQWDSFRVKWNEFLYVFCYLRPIRSIFKIFGNFCSLANIFARSANKFAMNIKKPKIKKNLPKVFIDLRYRVESSNCRDL